METAAKSIVLLLVDDEEKARSAIKRLFFFRTPRQFEFVEAPGGEEAVAVLRDRPVDCVLLDYDMPGGSGLAWLPRIGEAAAGAPVIVLTGKGDEATAVQAMKSGASDYLVKGSLRQEGLERAILHAVEKARMRREIEAQREKLVEAERHRVMIESLGAACHHLGQPATVILTYLELMKRQETDPGRRDMVARCIEAATAIADVLDQLQRFSRYRSEPYLPASGAPPVDSRIIRLVE